MGRRNWQMSNGKQHAETGRYGRRSPVTRYSRYSLHRTAPGLLTWAIGAKIRPPDFAAFQRRSSRSSVSTQSPRPSSVSFSSSAAASVDRRARFHRAGSGRRTTTMPTRSPGRSASRRIGRRTPFSNSASMISMPRRIAQAEAAAPGGGRGRRAFAPSR